MKDLIFITSCGLLFLVPLLFVVNSVYEDGLIGRVSLLTISFIAATFLFEEFLGDGYDMLPQTVALIAAFTVFLIWHLLRFHRRVLKRRGKAPCGLHDQVGCPYKIEAK